jgi:hypothetical protein
LAVIIALGLFYADTFMLDVQGRGSVSIVLAQGPEPLAADINYKDLKTNQEKLHAVYNLIEQMRDEHNRQAAIARADWSAYKDKWYTYAVRRQALGGNLYHQEVAPLLAEGAALEEDIRNSLYTRVEWDALTPEEQDAAYVSMYGDRETLKDVVTKATSPRIDSLKSIDLSLVTPDSTPDPLEDYEDFVEDDAPGFFVVDNATQVTFTNVQRGGTVDSILYSDKGSNHFDGDFEHWVNTKFTSLTNSAEGGFWGIANEIGDMNDIDVGGGSFFVAFWHFSSDSLRLREVDSGTQYTATWNGPLSNTWYYHKIIRDDDAGTYGTLYDYIYDAPAMEAGDLQSTLTLILNSSKKDFQYVYGFWNNTYSSLTGDLDGLTRELDLREAGAAVNITNSPASFDFGTVATDSSYWSSGSAPSFPLDVSECYFNVTNDSGASVDITINATNWTGGVGWTNSGSTGENLVVFKAGKDGDANEAAMLTLNSTQQSFITSLSDGASKEWELKLDTGTFTDGVTKSSTVTLVATLS